jgi:hypothetical protein
MAVDHATHYAEMERQLRTLLQKFAYRLTKSDLADAEDFIAEGEYGLALEAIAEGLREQDGHINSAVAEYITPLAEAMKIKNRPFLKAL